MEKIVINGGVPLFGRVDISGSKNAALPLLYATLPLRGISYIDNLPDISDVRVSLKILEGFGARVEYDGTLARIDTSQVEYSVPAPSLISELRASSYLIGASLSAFGRAHIQSFGGCNFDTRPIDMHLSAAAALGGEIEGELIRARRLVGGEIRFPKISVGATVNAMLMAASAHGETNIYNPATEPHIVALADFLRASGASVEILPGRIRMVGAALSPSRASVIPDMIEAGTYLIAGLATGGAVTAVGAEPTHLEAFLDMLRSAGAEVLVENGEICARADRLGKISITTAPHPGFPTDLQPQAAALMALFSGGDITEGVWSARFGYLSEFEKFGVPSSLSVPRAVIERADIHPARVTAGDLRAAAAEVILALAADGESIIENARHIKRGYSDMKNKLSALGARIEYTK